MVPAALLSLTLPVVFLVPADTGEKLGLSLSVLLALSVTLTATAQALPSTSDQVCVLQVYLTMLNGVAALAVVAAAFLARLHHRAVDAPVGAKTRMATVAIRRLTCMHTLTGLGSRLKLKHDKVSDIVTTENEQHGLKNENSNPAFGVSNKSRTIEEEAKIIPLSKDNVNGQVQAAMTWQDVAAAADWALFLVTSLSALFATLVCQYVFG